MFHFKPYNAPSQTLKQDNQDDHHDEALTESSHDSDANISVGDEERTIASDYNEIQSQDDHSYKRIPPSMPSCQTANSSSNNSLGNSRFKHSSPYSENNDSDCLNNECNDGFIASNVYINTHSSDFTQFQNDADTSNQFCCSTLLESGGYFPLFAPVDPKTLSPLSPIKYQDNEGT